jgi:hypothetical protein
MILLLSLLSARITGMDHHAWPFREETSKKGNSM